MRTITVICDHCGESMEDSEIRSPVFHDLLGTTIQLDLHVSCFAEFAKFCPQLPRLAKLS